MTKPELKVRQKRALGREQTRSKSAFERWLGLEKKKARRGLQNRSTTTTQSHTASVLSLIDNKSLEKYKLAKQNH